MIIFVGCICSLNMKTPLKNIVFGFLVSFFGSLPLSYLNIVGLEVYSKSGLDALISYLSGVIVTQTIVVYLCVIFARILYSNRRLMKAMDFFAVFFLLTLAFFFYTQGSSDLKESNYFDSYIRYNSFIIGLVLCALNFLQLPFWIIWNLYLVNAKYIALKGQRKFSYIVGTIIGTFFGMLLAIVALEAISENTLDIPAALMPMLLASIFIVLALWQSSKVYKKYYRQSH